LLVLIFKKKSGFRRVSSRNIRFAQFNVRLTISFKIVINFFLRAENFQLMILDRPFSLYTYKKPTKKTQQKQKNETSLCSNFNCVCAVYYNISRCVKQFFELLNFMPLSYDEKNS